MLDSCFHSEAAGIFLLFIYLFTFQIMKMFPFFLYTNRLTSGATGGNGSGREREGRERGGDRKLEATGSGR